MGDFFRFWWGLFYWNARKTAFVARGRRGRCPCQSPSDSGKAWQTRCEAAQSWDRPGRFCRICPALRKGPDGWTCSLNTHEVRPFWSRPLAWYGGTALVFYVVAAAAAFGVLVSRDYAGLSPLDTLLPTRWERVTAARRDMFLRRAHAALRKHDVQAMWLSLASASVAAPEDYEARLALAQIYSQLMMRTLAETEFRDLLQRFPAHRERTAIVFHDVLLTTRQFDALGRLALEQLAAADTTRKEPWLQALFVALRGSRSPVQLLRREQPKLDQLPALWRQAVQAEAAYRAPTRTVAPAWPEIPGTPEHGPLSILVLETTAEREAPELAVDTITRAAPVIGAFERERLLHRVHASEGSERLALQAVDGMLRLAGQPAQRERMLAALVEYPNAEHVQRLLSAVSNPQAHFTARELGGVWVAAICSANDVVRAMAERRLKEQYSITIANDTPREFSPASAGVWTQLIPLDREAVCVLSLKARRTDRPPPEGQ